MTADWHYSHDYDNNSTMKTILDQIQVELRANYDPKHRDQLIWFFKNQSVRPIGVRSAQMNKLVIRFWRNIKHWDKPQIWELCDELWKTKVLENGHLACKFAFRVDKRLEADDFALFKKWTYNYIYNWAHCDDLCTHALGEVIDRFPHLIKQTESWHTSNNRWVRRGLAVTLINPLKNGNLLEHSLLVADRLLLDKDDLVQKGYGWMLKVASQSFPEEVFRFVLDRRSTMPRTALRYAIEKLPKEWRKEAMSKTW